MAQIGLLAYDELVLEHARGERIDADALVGAIELGAPAIDHLPGHRDAAGEGMTGSDRQLQIGMIGLGGKRQAGGAQHLVAARAHAAEDAHHAAAEQAIGVAAVAGSQSVQLVERASAGARRWSPREQGGDHATLAHRRGAGGRGDGRGGLAQRRWREHVGKLDGGERLGHRQRMREALRRILAQRARDQRVERRRHARRQGGEAWRLVEHDAREQRHGIGAGVGPATAHQLEEHHPQREHVALGPDVLGARGLLRRHVGRRADSQALAREHHVGVDARHAEIDELDQDPIRSIDDEEVRGLEIAVHDARAMQCIEPHGGLANRLGRLAQGQTLVGLAAPQIAAVEPLERQPGTPLHLAVRHVPDDVRAVDALEEARLAVKALATRGIQRGMCQLQRDRPIGLGVARAVHRPESAVRDVLQQREAARDGLLSARRHHP
jgi:hypothetical protein